MEKNQTTTELIAEEKEEKNNFRWLIINLGGVIAFPLYTVALMLTGGGVGKIYVIAKRKWDKNQSWWDLDHDDFSFYGIILGTIIGLIFLNFGIYHLVKWLKRERERESSPSFSEG